MNTDKLEKSAPTEKTEGEISGAESRIAVEDFCDLANKFLSQQMYDEAIQLYETAIKMFPSSLALKINLGRARDLQKRKESLSRDKMSGDFNRRREQSDRLANHYLGLADSYIQRGNEEKALELLELAKHENPNLYLAHYLTAEILYRQDDLERALDELESAKKTNPFHEETLRLIGKIHTERADYENALNNYIDAFLLSLLKHEKGNPVYKGKIRFLFDKLHIETRKERNERIKTRMLTLNALLQELEQQKKTFFETSSFVRLTNLLASTREHREVRTDRLKTALHLRRFPLLQDLIDDELYKIARIASSHKYQKGDIICSEGDDSGCMYLIESGRVKIFNQTPVGEQEITVMVSQEYFGELNFIDSASHATSAVAIEDSGLWLLDNAGLRRLFEVEREIAVHFYWNFWKALAQRTRRTNELMKTFFEDSGQVLPQMEKDIAKPTEIHVDVKDKLDVLATRGLSSKELRLLATFSTEKHFGAGDYIFREGDPGDKLYIILDGKIIISKDIPGVGEEALAILERGDFFGEMALIDQSPRSADAKAHADGVTVLSIDKRALDEILSLDVESAYQFLHLLCKILTHRLREITVKLTSWRIMSGHS